MFKSTQFQIAKFIPNEIIYGDTLCSECVNKYLCNTKYVYRMQNEFKENGIYPAFLIAPACLLYDIWLSVSVIVSILSSLSLSSSSDSCRMHICTYINNITGFKLEHFMIWQYVMVIWCSMATCTLHLRNNLLIEAFIRQTRHRLWQVLFDKKS